MTTAAAPAQEAIINDTYPFRPNYTGPKEGVFAYVHHAIKYEWSHDINERGEYVRTQKLEHERAIRLHCIAHLSLVGIVPDAVWRQRADLLRQSDDLWRQSADLLLPYAAAIAAEVDRLVPDAPWDAGRGELVFVR